MRNRTRMGWTLVLSICLLVGCEINKEQTKNQGSDGENPAPVSDQEKAANDESSTIENIGQWTSDSWNNAVSGGNQAVESTGDWLNRLYRSAKETGSTSAGSVKDWVADDWSAQGDWQYKILAVSASDVAAVETELNKAGADRWECYHVDTATDQWKFFLKRSRRSYLSQIPLKDLANFLPGAIGDGE